SFASPIHHLVSDPASSLAVGDVITLSAGFRTSKTVRHVVTGILAPFGTPIESRPRVKSLVEILREREERRREKRERRRESRGEAEEFVGKRRKRRELLDGKGGTELVRA
ncbi:MAG: hypothetical protein M1829_006918, partial [Trizodia sp. TS-e1964]